MRQVTIDYISYKQYYAYIDILKYGVVCPHIYFNQKAWLGHK